MWTGAGCQRVCKDCKESSVESDHDSTRLIKPGPKWFHKTSDYFKPCQCWDNTRTNHNKPGFRPSEDSYMTSRSSANGQVVFYLASTNVSPRFPKLFSQYQGFHGSVRVAIGRLPATGLQSQHSIFNQFQPSQYISAMGSWGFRNVCTCLTRVSMAYASASTSAWDAGRPRGFVLVSVLKTSRNNVSFGLITVRYNLIRCKWCIIIRFHQTPTFVARLVAFASCADCHFASGRHWATGDCHSPLWVHHRRPDRPLLSSKHFMRVLCGMSQWFECL
jgi:hypothetical protein